MPYKTEWVKADLFVKHKGVSIYCTYDNQDYEDCLFYHYSTNSMEDDPENDDFDFDVRDLNTYQGDDSKHADYIRAAIAKGELKQNEKHHAMEEET